MNQIHNKGKKIQKNKRSRAKLSFKSPLERLRKLKRAIFHYVSCFRFDQVNKNLENLLKSRTPFKITNVPDMFGSSSQVELKIQEILEGNGPIDISVSENTFFSGHYSQHKIIPLTFEQFLNYDGPYNFYLAQFPLYEKLLVPKRPSEKTLNLLNYSKEQENDHKKLEKILKHDNNFASFISNIQDNIYRINLWFSKKKTFSNLHYDSFDNFLFMLKGKKIFNIYPPDDHNTVCESILTDSFHQAKRNKKSQKFKLRIVLQEKEAIFLPQGWFHEVASFGDQSIIALNVWFHSIEDICKNREKYLLRYLIAKRIKRETKNLLNIYRISIEKSLINIDASNLKLLTYNQKAEYILENFVQNKPLGVILFIKALYETPDSQVRSLVIGMLDVSSKLTQALLLNLDNCAVEYLTNRLEEIDSTAENSVDSSEGKRHTIDEFYNTLHQKLEYSTITEYFLKCKNNLREAILKDILFKKFVDSYKF